MTCQTTSGPFRCTAIGERHQECETTAPEYAIGRRVGVVRERRRSKRGRPMNIYVASSWRNALQPTIVAALRDLGHEVYDFRNPAPGNTGFAWSSIDPDWQRWTPDAYRAALQHSIAVEGYRHDITALRACDACVLVLPSGRSASWEFGYAMGQGKRGAVVQFDAVEPELMYREAEIITSYEELRAAFASSPTKGTDR